MKRVIYSLLIIFCVHFGSVLASIILEHLAKLFLNYSLIPWLKILVLPFELFLIYKLIYRGFRIEESEIKINQLLFFTVGLILCYPFKEFIEPNYIVCGNSLFDPIESKKIQNNRELHYFYDDLINKITYITYAIVLTIFTLREWKKLNSNLAS